jgi:recombinational DNA repair protein (RecF pathway)
MQDFPPPGMVDAIVRIFHQYGHNRELYEDAAKNLSDTNLPGAPDEVKARFVLMCMEAYDNYIKKQNEKKD